MNNQLKTMLLKLVRAKGSQELTNLLQEDFFKDSAWWPYGDTDSNFSIISAQSKDSVNALVEKIVNSIDALLIAECWKHDINPKGSEAPESMSKAVEKFFDIKDGDISSLSNDKRHALAQNIKIIAQGEKEKPNILIVDTGEGQNPEDFLETFLSLPGGKKRSNKTEIKFVQGKYNMGGTGALMFCGNPENRYQLILSKRNPKIKDSKNVWGFTLVRETIKENSKSPLFEFLVNKDGDIYSFFDTNLNLLPENENFNHGTFIKLYNYDLRNPSNINLDLWRPLNRKLFVPALPVTLHETRFEKESIHGATRIMEGNKFRVNGDENKWVEKYFEISSDLGRLGNRKIEITIFKDRLIEHTKNETKLRQFPTGEFTIPSEAIFFTVNGQTHHTIGRSTLDTHAKLKNLSKYMMIHIDVTSAGPLLNEIFHGAREAARENEIYREIEERLLSDLKDNPVLRTLDEEYRKREISKIQPDKTFVKNIAERMLKQNPDWIKQFPSGADVKINQPKGIPQNFVSRYIPTILELKGEKIRLVPINNKYSWVNFITDAPDNYLVREENRGEFKIECSSTIEKSYWLNEGLISLKIITPNNINKGSQMNIKVILTRPGSTSLESKFTIQYTKEKVSLGGPSHPRQPKAEGYNLPELDWVQKNRWGEFDPAWSAKDIAFVNSSIIHINAESFELNSFLYKHAGKYDESLIAEAYKTAIYLYTLILDHELESTSEDLIVKDNKDKLVSKLMQGIAKVVLPLNFENFLKEVDN